MKSQTIAGQFVSNSKVTLENICLPEFMSNRVFDSIEARIINTDCRYDMIIGRDALRLFKLNLSFKENMINMEDISLSMRPFPKFIDPTYTLAEIMYINILEQEIENEFIAINETVNDIKNLHQDQIIDDSENDTTDAYISDIKPAHYEAMNPEEVLDSCSHLDIQQKEDLRRLIKKYPQLFDGILRSYPTTVSLEVDPTKPPKAVRPYTVPTTQLNLFKNELMKLLKIGVLERGTRSKWISGSFIIPKKNNEARWITDFRALNKAIIRKKYPLPRVQDILERRGKYKYLTKLDLSMCFYTNVLDSKSKKYTTISTPFGLFHYNRLPMGTNQSPDIAQEELEKTLQGIDNVKKYIDDIAIFSNNWNDHIRTLDLVFQRLQQNGFSINPKKCEWAVQETDFLGYYLTPNGIKPLSKQVRAILDLQAPKNIKQLRAFIGLCNYY